MHGRGLRGAYTGHPDRIRINKWEVYAGKQQKYVQCGGWCGAVWCGA